MGQRGGSGGEEIRILTQRRKAGAEAQSEEREDRRVGIPLLCFLPLLFVFLRLCAFASVR
jgi:hypothetical protein